MSKKKNNRLKLKTHIEPPESVPVARTVECDEKDVDLVEKINIPAGQSTPKRLDILTQDSLNLDYHSSLCTQTQDGGVEVTWDWHSPGRKAVGANGKSIKKNDVSGGGTPKRTRVIQKKRISNSPLMYKPLKRKLIKHENTDDIDKFKAELIALSEQIKNAQEDEPLSTNDSKDSIKIDIPEEIEFDSSEDETGFVVSINNEIQKPLEDDEREKNKDFDDLFDDSLNDTMIRCSQEIEERLNIGPPNEKKASSSSAVSSTNNEKKQFSIRNNSHTVLTNVDKKMCNNNISMTKSVVNVQTTKLASSNIQASTLRRNTSHSFLPKTVLQSSKNSTIAKQTSNRTSSNSITNSGQQQTSLNSKDRQIILNAQELHDLDIPDDSFDEFLVSCEDEFVQSDTDVLSTAVKRYGKVYDSAHTISPRKLFKTANNVSYDNTISTVAYKGTSNSAQLPKMAISSHSTSNSDRHWKFFKSKSHSESSFISTNKNVNSNSKLTNPGSIINTFASGSNSNLDLKSGSKVVSASSVSTQHPILPIRRTASCLVSNMSRKSMQSVNTDNTQMLHVNRYAVKEDGNATSSNEKMQNSGDVASHIQSLQLCGPEEIEKKRREAKMKLEAKKKRDKINSQSALPCVPSTTRNKR